MNTNFNLQLQRKADNSNISKVDQIGSVNETDLAFSHRNGATEMRDLYDVNLNHRDISANNVIDLNANVPRPTQKKYPNRILGKADISCFDCTTTTTSLWRRDNEGNPVCNACRLYFLHNNRKRPFGTKQSVIRRRNRKKLNDPAIEAYPKKQPTVEKNLPAKDSYIFVPPDPQFHVISKSNGHQNNINEMENPSPEDFQYNSRRSSIIDEMNIPVLSNFDSKAKYDLDFFTHYLTDYAQDPNNSQVHHDQFCNKSFAHFSTAEINEIIFRKYKLPKLRIPDDWVDVSFFPRQSTWFPIQFPPAPHKSLLRSLTNQQPHQSFTHSAQPLLFGDTIDHHRYTFAFPSNNGFMGGSRIRDDPPLQVGYEPIYKSASNYNPISNKMPNAFTQANNLNHASTHPINYELATEKKQETHNLNKGGLNMYTYNNIHKQSSELRNHNMEYYRESKYANYAKDQPNSQLRLSPGCRPSTVPYSAHVHHQYVEPSPSDTLPPIRSPNNNHNTERALDTYRRRHIEQTSSLHFPFMFGYSPPLKFDSNETSRNVEIEGVNQALKDSVRSLVTSNPNHTPYAPDSNNFPHVDCLPRPPPGSPHLH